MRIEGVRTAAAAVSSSVSSSFSSLSASLGSLSLVACATLTAAGCGNGHDVITDLGLPGTDPQSVAAGSQGVGQPPDASRAMMVTPEQQRFLNAVDAAGIHPSSKLAALSIGSNVCQARAAHQSDQAVWDFVVPAVRGDVREVRRASSVVLPAGEVDSVTADYIRIATEQLC